MTDLVMGAMGSLIPKLHKLLTNEEDYNLLQPVVNKRIRSFIQELEVAQDELRKVAEGRWDQLDEEEQIWARQVRETSYDMEDVLDTFFFICVNSFGSTGQAKSLLKSLKEMSKLLMNSKARGKISTDVKEVTEQCCTYKVGDTMVKTTTTTSIIIETPLHFTPSIIDHHCLHVMYNKVKYLVGMDKSSDEVISLLQSPEQGRAFDVKTKIVSIVGFGGLGKTTLARAVYDKLKGYFDCRAFVHVGRNHDMKKVIKDILFILYKKSYLEFSRVASLLDERQLISELHSFLENKRYFIVVDDLWEVESSFIIRLADGVHNNCGGRIIITTRKVDVATAADEVYWLQPLSYDRSRELLHTRICGHEGKYVDNELDEISYKILRKCGGTPLNIITMASLLAKKQRHEWSEVYEAIGFEHEDDMEAGNTIRILSFAYNDLPSHLKTCLLYLSAFPEGYVIPKDSLIWMWIAEGFICPEHGKRLFEIGEDYFYDLINRSMIEAVQSDYDDGGIINGCRVHDIVLDFIGSLSREVNFFTLLDNNQAGTPAHSNNVRRLAHHNMAVGKVNQVRYPDMSKVRSFIALGCGIEVWPSPLLSSLKLLRVLVLAIQSYRRTDAPPLYIEHLEHLLHLRFLGLHGAQIHNIPRRIVALGFLQTLDLWDTDILDLPSRCMFPKQLMCLRVTFDDSKHCVGVPEVAQLTSLEELSISVKWKNSTATRQLVKELGRLRELRVLDVSIWWDAGDEEAGRDLVKSLGRLHKLQHLRIQSYSSNKTRLQATELVLPCHRLQHLAVSSGVMLCKLPSCIDPSCLPNLCHLDLHLEYTDEKDLQILGRLLELRFLALHTHAAADDEKLVHALVMAAGAFPKLQYFYNMGPLVLTFLSGAMPCLECFKFDVNIQSLKDCSLGFHHIDSLRHLPLLEKVHATIVLGDAKMEEAEEAEAALRYVVQSHPNHPNLILNRVGMCIADKQIILRDKLHHSQVVASGVMPMELLNQITNGFSEKQNLGTGNFGTVYRGVQNGKDIAVKLLHSMPHRLDYEEEFIKNLRRLNHPNIVQLLGYCYEIKPECVQYKGKLVLADKTYIALCFEFMHNGSLQSHLHNEFHGLNWHTCYKIIKGTCEGLKYLHEGLETPMYHLDLRPCNILMDKNMVPQLADFGLAKLFSENKTQPTLNISGTIRYWPPEYIEKMYISKKFDIFSLGIVMMEIIAGSEGYRKVAEMPPDEFINHVQENWRKRLQATPGYTLLKYECHQVKRCIEIALDCIHHDLEQRPNIGDITSWLNETENNTEKSAMTFTSQNDDDGNVDEIKYFGSKQTDFTDQECNVDDNNDDGEDKIEFGSKKTDKGEMSCTLSIIEVPMTASLGAMGPLVWKLNSLLASESHLQRSAEEAIKLLKEDLEEINADLVELSMVERPNYKTRYWMNEVRELSYHIEDCIDNMMRSRAAAKAKVRFSLHRPQLRVCCCVKIPWLPKIVQPSARITELRTLLWEARERHERYQLEDCVSSESEPRFLFSGNNRAPAVAAAVAGAADNLVVVDGTRGKLTSWLIDQTEAEQQQLKVLSIHGPGGVGKTTLVKELYRELRHRFECWAFVRVSRNPDMKRILGEILSQVQGRRKQDYECDAASTADNLMDSIRSHLQDKSYFVVIDELWDAAAWDIMNIAFPKGNNCSRIIITAEGKDVASKCYYVNNLEMAPLGSLQDSGKIFFDRVFGSEHQCPARLKDISCMIIRSCGGFPLAITTVASLLASQVDNTELWDYLQKSFISRLTGVTLEETCKEVVNVCYDALPQDLKTCLLYFTMYPEGCTIRKVDLLNQWIAEGFITPNEANQAVAESYFAELINRGMIQPEKIDHNDEVLSCTVHHIVFDLISQKSREENFITALDYSQAMPGFSMTTRRLSLHFSCAQFAAKPEGINLSQVRSLAFYGLFKCMPSMTKLKFIRVLILEFWGDNYHHNTSVDLSKLCILFHLRYLKVSSHIVIVLPSQIRRLKSLKTLEIDAQVSAVPTDIFHLPGMLHLRLPNGTELPDGIGRITSLQTLEHFDLGSNSEDNAQSLGELINLQNLHVTCSKAVSDHHLKRNLVALSSSIGKLSNLKSLRVGPFAVGMTMFIDQDDMPCTPKLFERLKILPSSFIFSRLPRWIGGLKNLRVLKISIRVLLSSDIDTLTGLPVLAVLSLYVQKSNAESVIFNSGSLPALKYFKYRCAALCLGFQKEALPNLERLKLCFNVHRAESFTSKLAGLEYLLKLKEITAEIGAAAGAGESDRRAAESVLKEATRKHPRFPINMNVRSVDCIEEESTPARFMHHNPYIVSSKKLNHYPYIVASALAIVVVLSIMLYKEVRALFA